MQQITKISPAAKGLIEELFRHGGWFGLTKSPSPSVSQLMANIVKTGEIGVLPYLVVFAREAPEKDATEAAQAAALLCATQSSAQWIALDGDIRANHYSWPYERYWDTWHKLKPGNLAGLLDEPCGKEGLVGLISMHSNGHAREAALRALMLCDSGAEIPFLLLRVTDWVSSIRTLAIDAVRRRMQPAMAGAFAAHIGLAERLAIRQRAAHSDLLNEITLFLSRPECRPQLEESLRTVEASARRSIYQILARAKHGPAFDLIEQALAERDPRIRIWAIRVAGEELRGDALRLAIGTTLKDRFGGVRVEASRVLVAAYPDQLATSLPGLLMDANATVRSIARYHLGRIGTYDIAAHYRACLASERNDEVVIALLSLGEISGTSVRELLRSYLADPRSRVCSAAIRMLARLDGDAFANEFMRLLMEGDMRVTRESMRALTPRAVTIDTEVLWRAFEKAPEQLRRMRILQVLAQAPKWDALYYIITAMGDQDEAVAQRAWALFGGALLTFNQSSVMPSEAQRARVQLAFAAIADSVNDATREWCEFVLK